MSQYTSSFISSERSVNLSEIYTSINEQIQTSKIDQALELLIYIEKILEHNSVVGALDLENNLLLLHTSSFCYIKY